MEKNKELLFADKSVKYGDFIRDLASELAMKLHQIEKGDLEISQAQAFKMFGRADVERWIKNGKITPSRISPGKKRYKLIELQKLANVQQNYLL